MADGFVRVSRGAPKPHGSMPETHNYPHRALWGEVVRCSCGRFLRCVSSSIHPEERPNLGAGQPWPSEWRLLTWWEARKYRKGRRRK